MKNNFLTSDQQLDFPLNYAGIRKTLVLLRSVNHNVRQRIIEIIGRGKKIVVTDICNELCLDQSAVSQHLSVLRQSGVVKTERKGKFIFYFLNHERLQLIHALVQLETTQNGHLMPSFEPQKQKRIFFWQ
jgi:DNA-binding transcriptional ArsR family regulator